MRTSRRRFIAGLLATGIAPRPTWADAGGPIYLSAAARPDGSNVLCGIDAALNITFQLPLPARGHAAAAHPNKPEAIAFARRPGTFAVIIDCVTGAQKAALHAPTGRHFYGHGTFSSDGTLLYTTENDFESGRGRIGVWDATNGYTRIDEWDSGGIGPHDIKRLPDGETLVVANGGIDTHPDTGRTKLNLPTMRPNLSYIEAGTIVEMVEPPLSMHKNSIRHLAVAPDGRVAFGMQWQGDGPVAALVGTHRRNAPLLMMEASADQVRRMNGYVGSVAFAADGKTVAATSPRGGYVQVYATHTRRLTDEFPIPDVSGVAATGDGFVTSSGQGVMLRVGEGTSAQSALAWDNHLIRI